MAAFYVAMAGMSGVLACLCFYMSSKHQQLFDQPLPVLPIRWIGLTALMASYGLLCCGVSPLTAAYMLVMFVMLSGSLLPPVIAILRKWGRV